MPTYYLVTKYTERGWLGEDVTECAVVDLDYELSTGSAVTRLITELRKDHKDALLVWWAKLDGEENNGSNKTEDATV